MLRRGIAFTVFWFLATGSSSSTNGDSKNVANPDSYQRFEFVQHAFDSTFGSKDGQAEEDDDMVVTTDKSNITDVPLKGNRRYMAARHNTAMKSKKPKKSYASRQVEPGRSEVAAEIDESEMRTIDLDQCGMVSAEVKLITDEPPSNPPIKKYRQPSTRDYFPDIPIAYKFLDQSKVAAKARSLDFLQKDCRQDWKKMSLTGGIRKRARTIHATTEPNEPSVAVEEDANVTDTSSLSDSQESLSSLSSSSSPSKESTATSSPSKGTPAVASFLIAAGSDGQRYTVEQLQELPSQLDDDNYYDDILRQSTYPLGSDAYSFLFTQ